MSDNTGDGAEATVDEEYEPTEMGLLLREQIEARQGPDNGTLIVFDYVFDMTVKKKAREAYTYGAVFVEKQNKWYVSGLTNSVVSREYEHEAFMSLLAKPNVVRAMVATKFEQFKP